MAGDYSQFRYGGLAFPLPATPDGNLVATADPALARALAFFSWTITNDVGARLVAEAAMAGITAPITAAIAESVHLPPGPLLLSEQKKFPLLSIHRVKGHNDYLTTARSHEETTWMLHYVLPVLTGSQSRRLEPILHAIELSLAYRVETAMDPAYTPAGGVAGQQWTVLAGIERIDLTDCEYGAFGDAKGVDMQGLTVTLLLKERNAGMIGAAPWVADDNAIGIGDSATGTVVTDVVNTSTDHNAPLP